jgi:excisionase family DNA binding protein
MFRAKPVKNRLDPTNVRGVTEPWVSADAIADHLGVTKDSVYTWISKKDMPAHRVGRLWKFKVTEVDDWVRSSGADETAKPSKKGAR